MLTIRLTTRRVGVVGGNRHADHGREPRPDERAGTAPRLATREQLTVSTAGPIERLWRARRRHTYIDAFVRESTVGCLLEFRRNGRSLMTWRFPTRDEASAEALTRLRDLQRVGWNTHW
jgi:hypothetical protein